MTSAGAILISSLPYTAPPASTTYARPDFTCEGVRNRDLFYTFTPVVTHDSVTISLCGSNYDTIVFLASGSCESLSCLASNDQSRACSQSILEGQTLMAGTTYYIIVTGWISSSFGSVSMTVTGIPRVGCLAATVIPSIPYSFSANTPSIATTPANTCRDGSTVAGVTGAFWFTFTPASTINHVYATSCASFESVLVFASGSCASLQCSAPTSGNADFCLTQNNRGSQIADTTLLAGVQYFFVVTGSSAADFGGFTFSLGIDSSAALSISSPAANSVVGGSQLASLLISGLAGTFDAQGIVTLTISESSTSTPNIVVSAVVDFDARWSVPVNIQSLVDGEIVVDGRLVDPSQNTATTRRTFIKDSDTFVFISDPTANSFVNSASASSLVIQGTGEVGGSVLVTVADGDSSTPNVISSPAIVGADGTWSVSMTLETLRVRLSATITDTVGNTQISPSVTLSKDTAGAVSILSPSNFQFIISQARAPTVTVSGFGDPGARVVVVVSDSDPLTPDVISEDLRLLFQQLQNQTLE